MNILTKKLIKSYLFDYLKLKFPELKIIPKEKMFNCPFNTNHEQKVDKPTCNIYPPDSHELFCFDKKCQKIGDIFDLVRRLEPEMRELGEDEIGDYLVYLLGIKTDERVDKLFSLYQDAGFCLIPLKKQGQGDKSKEAKEGEWQQSKYKNNKQWYDWIKIGLGIGLNLGAKSNVIAIDIDSDDTYVKVEKLMGDTLIQKTKRGKHFLYSYDKDFDHINHSNLRNKGYEMEVRANNAYVVIAPTSIEGEVRDWNYTKIQPMSAELKKFLLELVDKKPEVKPEENIQECITNEKLDVVDLTGRRNDTFIKTAGVFRKWMNRQQLEKTLSFLSNNWIDKPIPAKEFKAMLSQVEKYKTYDKKEIADKIAAHLIKTKQTTARDLEKVLGYDIGDIHDALHYLLQEERVSLFRNVYKLLEQVEWKDVSVGECRQIDYKIPYFENYTTIRDGDIIAIGGISGAGKTHLAMNIVKKLVEQGKKPYYISSEPGGRFHMIAATLGLEDKDYFFYEHYNPEEIEIPDNAITIIDWLLPQNYAEVDKLYQHFAKQMKRHKGNLIIFSQLNIIKEEKTGNWKKIFYSDRMVHFFCSAVGKFLHPINDGGIIDELNPYIETSKLRESKIGKQITTIPLTYHPDTKLVEIRK